MPITLTEADTGRRVIYRPHPGAPDERGTIFRINPVTLVPYVLYDGDQTPKYTEPRNLEWLP